ncbi:MAG: hypothetical protein M3P85_11080 [Actinomycetota bacterium]|nr:hypothetical protein [Actinomycetota bacterium]
MVHEPSRVVAIRPSAAATRRARRDLNQLVLESQAALAAVQAGDIEMMWTAHMLVNRAMGLVERNALDVQAVG